MVTFAFDYIMVTRNGKAMRREVAVGHNDSLLLQDCGFGIQDQGSLLPWIQPQGGLPRMDTWWIAL